MAPRLQTQAHLEAVFLARQTIRQRPLTRHQLVVEEVSLVPQARRETLAVASSGNQQPLQVLAVVSSVVAPRELKTTQTPLEEVGCLGLQTLAIQQGAVYLVNLVPLLHQRCLVVFLVTQTSKAHNQVEVSLVAATSRTLSKVAVSSVRAQINPRSRTFSRTTSRATRARVFLVAAPLTTHSLHFRGRLSNSRSPNNLAC